MFGVGLRYYNSLQNQSDIFKPEIGADLGGDFLSMPYSKIDQDITYEKGSIVE